MEAAGFFRGGFEANVNALMCLNRIKGSRGPSIPAKASTCPSEANYSGGTKIANIWLQGAVLQGLSAVLKLCSGVLLAAFLVLRYDADTAGGFWANAALYQVCFTLCGLGLSYGVVVNMGQHFSLAASETKAALAYLMLSMGLVYVGLLAFRGFAWQTGAIGLHFFVGKLFVVALFFIRATLDFKSALLLQTLFDLSHVFLVLFAWFFAVEFNSYLGALAIVDGCWGIYLLWWSGVTSISFNEHKVFLRVVFDGWFRYGSKIYATDIIGLALNGVDRIVIAALGNEAFLASYVLARKVYEVPHGLLVAQSSFIFSILVRDRPQKILDNPKSTVPKVTKSKLVLGYELAAILVYAAPIVVAQIDFFNAFFPMLDHFSVLVVFFTVIGMAQVSTIPILNITYAEGNSEMVLYYSGLNALFGLGFLAASWSFGDLSLVLASQFTIAIVSYCFMLIFAALNFGSKFCLTLSFAKLLVLGFSLNFATLTSLSNL